jgi:hypothetical protein
VNSPQQFRKVQCLFFGHDDAKITLTLGKILPEKVEAMKCRRCNRILIPVRSLGVNREGPESKAD